MRNAIIQVIHPKGRVICEVLQYEDPKKYKLAQRYRHDGRLNVENKSIKMRRRYRCKVTSKI